jgi:signal peptidase I
MTHQNFLRQGRRARTILSYIYTMSDELPTPASAPEHPKAPSTFFSELFRFALITLFIVLPIRIYIAQPFIVSGSSMDPTFENGEYLIVDELSYRLDEPERGDVIIFRYPKDTTKFFIKRIIGLPGETVVVNGKSVIVKNEANPEGLELDESYLSHETYSNIRVALDEDEYFVMGDNRPASSDSRIWGPLSRDLIVGRAFLRLLPVTRAAVLPGDYQYEPSLNATSSQEAPVNVRE